MEPVLPPCGHGDRNTVTIMIGPASTANSTSRNGEPALRIGIDRFHARDRGCDGVTAIAEDSRASLLQSVWRKEVVQQRRHKHQHSCGGGRLLSRRHSRCREN